MRVTVLTKEDFDTRKVRVVLSDGDIFLAVRSPLCLVEGCHRVESGVAFRPNDASDTRTNKQCLQCATYEMFGSGDRGYKTIHAGRVSGLDVVLEAIADGKIESAPEWAIDGLNESILTMTAAAS